MPNANAGTTRQGSRLIREDRRMTRNHWILLVVGLVAGLLISGRYALLAQDRGGTAPPNSSRSSRGSSTDGPKNDGAIAEPKAGADPIVADDRPVAQLGPKGSASVGTLQDALLRPYRFPFSRPTPLTPGLHAPPADTQSACCPRPGRARSADRRARRSRSARARRSSTQDRFEVAPRSGGPDFSHRRRGQSAHHHGQRGLGRSGRPDLVRAARLAPRPARPPGCRR